MSKIFVIFIAATIFSNNNFIKFVYWNADRQVYQKDDSK